MYVHITTMKTAEDLKTASTKSLTLQRQTKPIKTLAALQENNPKLSCAIILIEEMLDLNLETIKVQSKIQSKSFKSFRMISMLQ